MITEADLAEAIAECQGQRNPNASTCIKLAAFYTIRNELFPRPNAERAEENGYSFKAPEKAQIALYSGDSEFAGIVSGRPMDQVLAIFDELMQSLQVVEPRLYAAVLRKFAD